MSYYTVPIEPDTCVCTHHVDECEEGEDLDECYACYLEDCEMEEGQADDDGDYEEMHRRLQ
jgi:hypothetical protein